MKANNTVGEQITVEQLIEKAQSYDDIQGNDYAIQASRPCQVDRLLRAYTTITPHIDRYPTCIQCIKFMQKWSNALRTMT